MGWLNCFFFKICKNFGGKAKMKTKRILALLVVMMMVFGLAAPTSMAASGPTVSAAMSGSDVVVKVTDGATNPTATIA